MPHPWDKPHPLRRKHPLQGTHPLKRRGSAGCAIAIAVPGAAVIAVCAAARELWRWPLQAGQHA